MTGTLLVTSALMGLAGSVHCAGMCSAACSAVGRASLPGKPWRASALLLLARLVSYALAGALVGWAAEGLRWLVDGSAWLKPLWTVAQVAIVALGLWLLVSGELPPTMVQWAERRGRLRPPGLHKVHLPGELKVTAVGMLWALLPCGLLHAALALSALASSPLEASQVMAAFAVTSSAGLVAGQAVWRYVSGGDRGAAPWGGRQAIRLAGGSITLVCLWPLAQHVWAPLQSAWCG